MSYCMYLRKSRADAEAEARGEVETLSRHHRTLMELAKRRGVEITAEYREIVSGDSIAARPQMQAMLADIAAGKYKGVLCMEIERLARGNTIDQGIVAQAFKDSGTLIITPTKTYDPDNEFDEEYFEFSLFMSRREYKTIKRRMQAGRLATIKEGNYISPTPPYGYRKVHPEPKVHTLEIVPDEAEVVRMIYAMYLEGSGSRAIASELNRLGIQPQKNTFWEKPSIKKILANPVYMGMLQWRTKGSGETCYQGKHPAIIDPETFLAVQEKRETNPAAQVPNNLELQNYYHNILYCGECGHQMKRRLVKNNGKAHILCRYNQCRGKVVSATIESVDESVLSALRFQIESLEELERAGKSDPKPPSTSDGTIKRLRSELERLTRQQDRLYDLLEQEIYDNNTFLERMGKLVTNRKAIENRIAELEASENKPKRSPGESISQLRYVIDHFNDADVKEKNRLLHLVVNKIYYHKTERACYRKPGTDLWLDIDFV
ncbi:MAG: recombinase family protein [Oscillospiraceae bacterium]|nr:recombinase family protein [Oscillospiraceae bacterium]